MPMHKCLCSSTARSAVHTTSLFWYWLYLNNDLINVRPLLVLRHDRSPELAKPMWKVVSLKALMNKDRMFIETALEIITPDVWYWLYLNNDLINVRPLLVLRHDRSPEVAKPMWKDDSLKALMNKDRMFIETALEIITPDVQKNFRETDSCYHHSRSIHLLKT